jgi:hypothetical protein
MLQTISSLYNFEFHFKNNNLKNKIKVKESGDGEEIVRTMKKRISLLF